MFDISVLPQLIRHDVEHEESNLLPEHTRFIFQTIGIEESYWPSWALAA